MKWDFITFLLASARTASITSAAFPWPVPAAPTSAPTFQTTHPTAPPTTPTTTPTFPTTIPTFPTTPPTAPPTTPTFPTTTTTTPTPPTTPSTTTAYPADAGCQPGEIGATINGYPTCIVAKECTLFVGMVYWSYDRYRTPNKGTCYYTLSETIESVNTDLLEPFKLQLQTYKAVHGKTAVDWIDIWMYGSYVRLAKGLRAFVDGVEIQPPYTTDSRWKIYIKERYIFFKAQNGLEVFFMNYAMAKVTTPDSYANQVRGICGDMNGESSNDMLTRERIFIRDPVMLIQSWMVPEARENDRCPVFTPPKKQYQCTEADKRRVESSDWCGMIIMPSGPFPTFFSYLNPQRAFTDCVQQECLRPRGSAADQDKRRCDVIASFVEDVKDVERLNPYGGNVDYNQFITISQCMQLVI